MEDLESSLLCLPALCVLGFMVRSLFCAPCYLEGVMVRWFVLFSTTVLYCIDASPPAPFLCVAGCVLLHTTLYAFAAFFAFLSHAIPACLPFLPGFFIFIHFLMPFMPGSFVTPLSPSIGLLRYNSTIQFGKFSCMSVQTTTIVRFITFLPAWLSTHHRSLFFSSLLHGSTTALLHTLLVPSL